MTNNSANYKFQTDFFYVRSSLINRQHVLLEKMQGRFLGEGKSTEEHSENESRLTFKYHVTRLIFTRYSFPDSVCRSGFVS